MSNDPEQVRLVKENKHILLVGSSAEEVSAELCESFSFSPEDFFSPFHINWRVYLISHKYESEQLTMKFHCLVLDTTHDTAATTAAKIVGFIEALL